MTNFIVIEKDSLSKSTVNSANITLTEASIVHTKMSREDVAEFIRDGNNLVLKLKNGETVVIENFFIQYDNVASDLVFEEDGCVLYWFDGVSGFKGIPGLEVLLPEAGSKLGALLPWLVGAGVVGGIIAGSGGGDKNNNGSTIAPNKPPVAVDDTVTTEHDTPVEKNILDNDSDPESDPLEVKDFTVNGDKYQPDETADIPGVGTITIDKDGNLIFTPEPGYVGAVPPVDYTVTDGKGGEDTGTVTFEDVPDRLANNDLISMSEDTGTKSGNVLENDKPGLTVTSVRINGVDYGVGENIDIPKVGTVNIAADGTYSFTPVKDYSGEVPDITYTVSDGTQTDTAILDIKVEAVADQPVVGKFEFTPPPLNLNIQTWSNVKNINGNNLLKNGGDGASKEDLLAVIDFLRDPANKDKIIINDGEGETAIISNDSGQTKDLTSTDLGEYGAVYISGYIYLEAGQTYIYKGQGDDSAAIIIGDGVSSLHVNWEGTSISGKGDFTVNQSGFYSFQFYAHNADGIGNYDFIVENENGNDPIFYPNVDAIKESLKDTTYVLGDYDEGEDGSNDTGFYPVNMGYQGNSDDSIDLTGIHLQATDTDGSEYLSFVMSGLPKGAILSFKDADDIEHTITVGPDGKASYTPGKDATGTTEYTDFKLKVGDKTDALLDVTLEVTSTEKSNGDSSSSTLEFEVKVEDAEIFDVSYETESLIKTDAPTDKVTEKGLSAQENPWEVTNSTVNYWSNYKDSTSMGIRQDSAGVMEVGLRSGALATNSLVNGSKIAMQLAWNNGFQTESGQGESTVFKLMVNGIVYATVTTPSNSDGSPVDKTGQALITYENGASGNVEFFSAPAYEKDGGDPSGNSFEWNNWEIYLPAISGDTSVSLRWDVKQSTVAGDVTSDDLYVKDIGVYPATAETIQVMSMSPSDDNSVILDLLSNDNLDGNELQTIDEFTFGDSNDVIDVSTLLSDDANASNLAEFITVDYDAENDQAVISIDRDGSAEQYQSENLVVLLNQPNAFDLGDLLANKQIIIG
ncbi:hypothetical protein BBP83_07660 [Acinetobacter celticus]|uniref:Biofilm-associated protein BapA-like prefix-like domain-containing protein n=2 Tax=Acinetobacter celticus TaxID=1891224 RepID=A0A1C3CXA3_9GAMM|nr:Ig-like domain-containing protein [Acinetobacter celticus]ODA13303.1 hypothetical protein BBP83_07660 [Acinetobacter celticus]